MSADTPTTSTNTASSPRLTSFERELLTDLHTLVTQRAAMEAVNGAVNGAVDDAARGASQRGSARRTGAHLGRVRLAASVAAVAVSALAGPSILASGSPAYAVETEQDGSIVVRIHDFTDAAGLEAALTDHGVASHVNYSGSGSTITVDENGNVSLNDHDLVDEANLPRDPTPMDSTFGNGPSAEDACALTGSGDAPLSLKQDGTDYVITLSGAALDHDSSLTLTTVTGDHGDHGDHGDTVVATYGSGANICGVMVTT